MTQRCVRPQHTLGRDPLACLPHVHAYRRTEEVLDLLAIVVLHEPTGPAEGDAAHDEGGEVDEGDGVETGGEEAGDVLLIAYKQDAGDASLELGDCRHGL